MSNFWFHDRCFSPYTTNIIKLRKRGRAENNIIMRDILLIYVDNPDNPEGNKQSVKKKKK